MSTPTHIGDAIERWLAADGARFAPLQEVLKPLAEALFFASLATEEQRPTRVSLVWVEGGANQLRALRDDDEAAQHQGVDPELAWHVIQLERRPLDVTTLVKLAPVTDFGSSALVVGGSATDFYVDGVARFNRRTDGGQCLVLHAEAAGVVSVTYKRVELFSLERGLSVRPPPNVLAVEGPVRDAIKGIAREGSRRSIFEMGLHYTVAAGLLQAVNATRRGGLLLLLPSEPNQQALAATKLPAVSTDALAGPLAAYRHANRRWIGLAFKRAPVDEDWAVPPEEVEAEQARRLAYSDLESAIADVGRLAAIDNALLLSPGFMLVGAQFEVPSQGATLVVEARDALGQHVVPYDMRRHGSRHRAAACFANAHPGAVALVASADGPSKAFMRLGDRVTMWQLRLPLM